MAAPRSSDSSSEDEESSAKFREAVIDTPSVYQKDFVLKDREIEEKKPVAPSKRPDKEQIEYDEDQRSNILGTTPGIRKHISKKLTQVIDSDLEYTEKGCVEPVASQESENVIKLFSSSSKFLLEKNSSESEVKKPIRKRPVSSSSDSSSEDERLAEATVSHDFIMQQKDIPYPANQRPPDIVIKSPSSATSSDKHLIHTSDGSKHLNKLEISGKYVNYGDSNTVTMATSAMVDCVPSTTDCLLNEKHETQSKKTKKKRKKHKKEKKDT